MPTLLLVYKVTGATNGRGYQSARIIQSIPYHVDRRFVTKPHTPRSTKSLVADRHVNVPISGELMPEIAIDDFRMESVVCHESLGGLLKHYERKVA